MGLPVVAVDHYQLVWLQVKEEPSVRLQRRLSESNNAPLPPSIPCEACDATFDSRQMKNDHFLLMHPAPPPPPPKTPLSPLADDDVTADDKVHAVWLIWDTMDIVPEYLPLR